MRCMPTVSTSVSTPRRDGLKVIHLPGQFRVYDAISDAPAGSDGPNVTLSMKRVQTMLLRLEPVD